VTIELSGAAELIRDLDVAAAEILPRTRILTEEAGETLRSRWAANATQTAGKHGRLYPRSITAESVPAFMAAVVDVGPDSSKPQGGMGQGFEYGSVNQPPHLDGKKAADTVESAFVAALEAMTTRLL
jgi:hypothetical protein